MKPEQIDYTKERIKLINDELKKCADEARKKTLLTIKENILKFMDFKTKVNAA